MHVIEPSKQQSAKGDVYMLKGKGLRESLYKAGLWRPTHCILRFAYSLGMLLCSKRVPSAGLRAMRRSRREEKNVFICGCTSVLVSKWASSSASPLTSLALSILFSYTHVLPNFHLTPLSSRLPSPRMLTSQQFNGLLRNREAEYPTHDV